MPLDPLERLAHPEAPRRHVVRQLVPAKRRRDRRTRLRPHRVDRCDRLSPRVLTMIDEDPLPLTLQPFGRDEPRVPLLEPARHVLRERVGLLVGRAPRDRDEHVDPVGAARLDVGVELEPLELLADQVGDADREREAAVGRVEVEEHEVRAVGLVDAGVPRVHVDAVHLHHPEHGLRRVEEREVDEPRPALARVGAEGAGRNPGGHPLRRLLLEVDVTVRAVREALHRERAVAEVRDEHRRDRAVVLEQVLLRDSLVGEEDAFRAREADRPLCHGAGCTHPGAPLSMRLPPLFA